ncbi:HEAT repeat domain-containing protein [Shimia aestuarii]|uniref:Tetratricopeptide repeat-containing protein n=1 Tax=Shimia aestuarii TaxID=254406 RepID=A0A1I4RN04_9RHOB|nr:HEAT repeat domain-containing protein [Shimia aestuarii]SFM53516.1 Tetratricopeptide repeat-containing protein [Shimia aestuarii]
MPIFPTASPRPLPVLLAALFWILLSLGAMAEQDGYVGSTICADCHVEETNAWQSSHHALAWRMPGRDMLVGAFEGEVFEHDGMRTEFWRDGDTRMVRVTEKDGVTTEYKVHSVGGVAPLEQLLLETEPGRLQSFDVAWDVDEKRWYHIYPDLDLPPGDGLHWTGPYKNWNARCAECHATGYVKNFDPPSARYNSTQVEIGVGCEACHGPGAKHLELVKGGHSGDMPKSYGFAVDFSDTEAGMQQCAGCHARREAFGGGSPAPGTAFHDAYNLALLRPGTYHPDGQILDEVYVYGSFLQSQMYAKGVGCGNCHDPHSNERVAEGNAVCTQCHSPAGNPDFPSLALKEYDAPSHHRHAADSDGAQCKNCHMIERTYMGVDERRDHSFRIPRPDLADSTGAPDACTDCHTGQSPKWAADAIADWYPEGRWTQSHFGTALAKGLADPVAGAKGLIDLAGDSEVNALARATALWVLSNAGDAVHIDDIAPLLKHGDPLIRANAVSALRAIPATLTAPYLVAALEDPSRNVRLAAARAVVTIPPDSAPAALRPAYGPASRAMVQFLKNQFDFPEAHLQIAGIALTQREFASAERAFQTVVALDPHHGDAWVMLVRIAGALRGEDAARKVLAEALERLPDNPALLDLARQL